METRHVPVMGEEVLGVLRPGAGGVVVDCTLGLGGHTRLLAERVRPGGRVIAVDFDPRNIEVAWGALAGFEDVVSIHRGNFAGIDRVLLAEGVEKVDGVLADLGVASPQIDDPARGFSYRKPGPLDMRMDPGRAESAAQLLARLSEEEIRSALVELGDEEDAVAIARLIVREREIAPIETTERLTEIVCRARDFTLKRAAGAKLHPAARTFQALRILVNREIPNLTRLLAVVPGVLKYGGRVAILSFHSGEDRVVKGAFRDGVREGVYARAAKEPIVATEQEVRGNGRARSAKLRWAERAGEG